MKRTLYIALLGITLALGWWAFDLRSKLLRFEQENAELRRARDSQAGTAEISQSRLGSLEENVTRLTKERDNARRNGETTASSGSAASQKMNALAAAAMDSAEATSTPRVRAAMVPVLNSVILPKFRKDYASLLKKWNLSATDSDTVLSLLPGLEMGAVDYMMTHPSAKDLSVDELMAATEKFGQQTREDLKSVLGAERVAELDSFKKELKINEVVGPYAEHLDISGFPLTTDQKAKLADALSSPAAKIVPTDSGPIPNDMLRKRNEDWQAEIVQKATGFLSPDQISDLQRVFREQNEQQQATGKMIDEILKAAGDDDSGRPK